MKRLIMGLLTDRPQTTAEIAAKAGMPIMETAYFLTEGGALQTPEGWLGSDPVEVLHQAMRALLDTSAAPQDLRIVAGLGALVDHAKATGAVAREVWMRLAAAVWDKR